MSETYKSVGCSLSWANFQIPLLGYAQQCATNPATASATPSSSSSSSSSSGRRRRLQQLNEDGSVSLNSNIIYAQDDLAKATYQRIMVVGICVITVVLIHLAVLEFWR